MNPDYKSLSRGNSGDMSPAAIEARLDKVAELNELWKLLRTASPLRSDGTEVAAAGNSPAAAIEDPTQ